MLNNQGYDFLKPVALYVLPALAALYGSLAQAWPNLPYVAEIVGTIMVIDTLLGFMLDTSKTLYKIGLKDSLGYSSVTQPSLPQVDPNMPKWYIPKDLYDGLYWVAQVLLPGIGAAYFGLASAWGILHPEPIVASIAAVDTFLGVILAVSTYELNKAIATQNKTKEN